MIWLQHGRLAALEVCLSNACLPSLELQTIPCVDCIYKMFLHQVATDVYIILLYRIYMGKCVSTSNITAPHPTLMINSKFGVSTMGTVTFI